LYLRSVTSEVYIAEEGQRGALLYGESNGHSVATSMRTIYLLPDEYFYRYFYAEVDLYNFSNDIMLGTFYPDAHDGTLCDIDGNELRLAPSSSLTSYRCVVRVYFIDRDSYYNLHEDNYLVYTYSDSGTASFYVSNYNSSAIKAFEYSNTMYIGSNFLIRLNVLTGSAD
jgi:hypothetical protein